MFVKRWERNNDGKQKMLSGERRDILSCTFSHGPREQHVPAIPVEASSDKLRGIIRGRNAGRHVNCK